MKKLNLKSQLFLLFLASMLFSAIIFFIVTITSVVMVAKNEVYSRLSSYTYIMDSFNRDSSFDGRNLPDMSVCYYSVRDGNVTTSDNYDSFNISKEDVENLVNQLKEQNNDDRKLRIQGEVEINSSTYYYCCQEIENFRNYIIIITDNKYVSGLVSDVLLRVGIALIGLILIELIILSLWSNSYVNRIRRLQLHILDLPRNKYEKKYVDSRGDEIGELSNSIEKMRIELNSNESVKQEMLQNLSHDFKTPISVIKSYAEAMQDGIEDMKALNIIIEQSEILQNKVIKLLQYNSIEYLDHSKPFESINMKQLIEEVITNHKHQTNIEFQLELDENVIFNGYKENWDIVVSNIIENAMRYAKSNIKIELKDKYLKIFNDGEHIDEQFINNSFKPYEKGNKGQFGLGMSIVEKTCNFFGYSLSVENEEEGVSFIINK